MKTALITGIGGQDGSYLAELLLTKGYQVHGIELPHFEGQPESLVNIRQLLDSITMHYGSVADEGFLRKVLEKTRPVECYHLAASSFVSYVFEEEASILNNNVNSVHVLLGGLKQIVPECRLFFAGTSEMFGQVESSPQKETTPFRPRSVYGISKVAGHHLLDYYRQHHGIFACTGILYNHESTRRGPKFVTRKITSTAAKIKLGLESKLILGNLDAERDWGYAPDYVNVMWLMLQQAEPADRIIATGKTHTVRDFVFSAFTAVDLDYRDYVEVSREFYREKETVPLCGDASRALNDLGWAPTRTLAEMVEEMVSADMKILRNVKTIL